MMLFLSLGQAPDKTLNDRRFIEALDGGQANTAEGMVAEA